MRTDTMITKQFTPEWSSKPINMSSFLQDMTQLRRRGEMDNAVSKLVRSGNSEAKAGNHENAALFFGEAGRVLMHSGEKEERDRAGVLLGQGAQEYENAAKDVILNKEGDAVESPHDVAVLYSAAARLYKMSAVEEDLNDSARCFQLAATFFKSAAQLSEAAARPKERTEALWLLHAEANLSYSTAIMSRGSLSVDDLVRIANVMETASDSYARIWDYDAKSLLCLSKAINAIKQCNPMGDEEKSMLMRLLQKQESRALEFDDITAAAEAVLDQNYYGREKGAQG